MLKEIEEQFSKLESYDLKINQDNYLVKFDYLNTLFSLLIGKNFEYLVLDSNEFNTDPINVSLANIVGWSDIKKIFNEIVKILSESFVKKPTDLKEVDNFGIFRQVKQFDKTNDFGKLDYEKLKSDLEKSEEKSSLTLKSIPSNLLYSRKQIIDILINEIRKVNTNKKHPHYIVTTSDDYKFMLKIIYNDKDISKEKVILNFELTVDPDLHPYYPPSLRFHSPYAKEAFIYNVSNLDILRLENWNPIIDMDWLITNLASAISPYIEENVLSQDEQICELDRDLIELSSLLGEKLYQEIKFDISHVKFCLKEAKSSDNKYWKSGVGYGYSGREEWDISSYVKEQDTKNKKISTVLEKITKNELDEIEINKIVKSSLLKFIEANICNSTLLEIDKKEELFQDILKVLIFIFNHIPSSENNWKIKIYNGLEILRQDISPIISSIEISDKCSFYVNIIESADKIKDIVTNSDILESNNSDLKVEENDTVSDYMEMIKEEQMKIFNGYTIKSSHRYSTSKQDGISPKSLMRISSEFSSMRSNLPNNWETSIVVRASSDNLNIFSFVITGPEDTPYHNGVYEFHASFPKDYPNSEPKVLLDTTGKGTVRFNPNLYDCGKVCLSLLGTWRGSDGESWNKNTSTFLQVLVSIQSLILVPEPYFNEPGWEREMHTQHGKEKSFSYNDNIRVNNLRWAILDKFENPPYGFEEMTKNHFMMKKKEILEVTQRWIDESKKHKAQMIALRDKLVKKYNSEEGISDDDESADSKGFEPQTPPYSPDSKSGYTKLDDFEEMEISSEDDIIPPPSYEGKAPSDEDKIEDESSEEMDVIVLKPLSKSNKK